MKFYIISRRNVSEEEKNYYLINTKVEPNFERDVLELKLTKKQKLKIEQIYKRGDVVEEVILGGIKCLKNT